MYGGFSHCSFKPACESLLISIQQLLGAGRGRARRVAKRHAFGVPRVPCLLGDLHLTQSVFFSLKRGQRGALWLSRCHCRGQCATYLRCQRVAKSSYQSL